MAEFETVTSQVRDFGGAGYVAVERKRVKDQGRENDFLMVVRGFYLRDGTPRRRNYVTVPDTPETVGFIAAGLIETAAAGDAAAAAGLLERVRLHVVQQLEEAAAKAPPAPAGGDAAGGDAAGGDAAEVEARQLRELAEAVRVLDAGRGAAWEELSPKLQAAWGCDERGVEDALNRGLDRGVLYEPVLGRLKLSA